MTCGHELSGDALSQFSRMANFLVWVVWFVAAFACLASALAVVSFSNPFYSALSLIANLASLAVLYLLLSGEFVAAAQVLVYGGAVMVMFLFVIAYLGDRTDESPWSGGPSWQIVGAVLAGGAILAEVCVVVGLGAGGFLSQPEAHRPRVRLAGVDRAPVPHRPARRVRGDVDRAAGRRRRRRRARLARAEDRGRCTDLTSGGTSILAGLLFSIGALGVMLRRNPLIILLSVEIMLNSANLLLIAFSRLHGGEDGQVFAISVMAVAASEVVVGLGLIVAMGRRHVELDVDKLRTLRG